MDEDDICAPKNVSLEPLMQDELENYSFKSIYRCDAINTQKHFSSLLLLVCQSADQKKPDIHFFNCETVKVSDNTVVASQFVLPDSVCQV